MAISIIKQVTTCCRRMLINNSLRSYGIYSPPYLEPRKDAILHYPMLNIQIRGYTFPVLEKYQSFISKLADVLDIDIENGFAFPHQELKVKKFKKHSSKTEHEYCFRLYERDIQVSNISVTKYPIFIRLLEAALPEGVSLHIDTFDPAIEAARYIPDKTLLDLKSELRTVGKPV